MNNEITITEALAEIKLIDSKVQKKKEFITQFSVRSNAMVDPLGDSGGSRKVLEQEDQAVNDLLERKVKIRRAIQTANAQVSLTLEGDTRTVADWLVWRREVAPLAQSFVTELQSQITRQRLQAQQQRLTVVPVEKEPTATSDFLVNVSEKKLQIRNEKINNILGALDGKLSLHNATVKVTV